MINVLHTAINYKNGLLESTVDFDSIYKNFSSLFVYGGALLGKWLSSLAFDHNCSNTYEMRNSKSLKFIRMILIHDILLFFIRFQKN